MAEGRDLRKIRKAKNKRSAALLLAAIKAGHRYRMTSSHGVMVYGPTGTASTHLAGSCSRATENFRSDLRNAGVDVGER